MAPGWLPVLSGKKNKPNYSRIQEPDFNMCHDPRRSYKSLNTFLCMKVSDEVMNNWGEKQEVSLLAAVCSVWHNSFHYSDSSSA
jgi:hypothetical protein